MPRYIDADKLILSLRECAGYEHNKEATTSWSNACDSFIDEIEDLLMDDKADVAPVVHAKWIVGRYCSNCEFDNQKTCYETTKYCPDCGAKMGEESEEDNG